MVGGLVAVEASEQQLGGGVAERVRVLGDDGQAGVEHVAEWDVVEADVRDGVVRGELRGAREGRRW